MENGQGLLADGEAADTADRRDSATPAPIHTGLEALPAIIRARDERGASRRFIEFFTATMRNRNMLMASACGKAVLRPVRQTPAVPGEHSNPQSGQHLAAIRTTV